MKKYSFSNIINSDKTTVIAAMKNLERYNNWNMSLQY